MIVKRNCMKQILRKFNNMAVMNPLSKYILKNPRKFDRWFYIT